MDIDCKHQFYTRVSKLFNKKKIKVLNKGLKYNIPKFYKLNPRS